MTVGSATSGAVVPSTSIFGADSVSPVQQILKAEKDAAANTTANVSTHSSTSWQDQDWYLKAKVAQLKGQINTYSTLPGLDPSGAIMDSLTKEVNELIKKQQAKLKASQDEAAAKQAELDKQTAQNKLDAQIPSVELALQRAKDKANGITVAPYTPPDPAKGAASGDVLSSDDMLAHAKKLGGIVNTTA